MGQLFNSDDNLKVSLSCLGKGSNEIDLKLIKWGINKSGVKGMMSTNFS